jgi:hypothetical protein
MRGGRLTLITSRASFRPDEQRSPSLIGVTGARFTTKPGGMHGPE